MTTSPDPLEHKIAELTQYASTRGFAPGVDRQIAEIAIKNQRATGATAEQVIDSIDRMFHAEQTSLGKLGTALGDVKFTLMEQATYGLDLAARGIRAAIRHAGAFARRVLLRR